MSAERHLHLGYHHPRTMNMVRPEIQDACRGNSWDPDGLSSGRLPPVRGLDQLDSILTIVKVAARLDEVRATISNTARRQAS